MCLFGAGWWTPRDKTVKNHTRTGGRWQRQCRTSSPNPLCRGCWVTPSPVRFFLRGEVSATRPSPQAAYQYFTALNTAATALRGAFLHGTTSQRKCYITLWTQNHSASTRLFQDNRVQSVLKNNGYRSMVLLWGIFLRDLNHQRIPLERRLLGVMQKTCCTTTMSAALSFR